MASQNGVPDNEIEPPIFSEASEYQDKPLNFGIGHK